MKRWVAIAAMVVGLLGVMMAPAHADPTNAPGAVPITVTCDGTSYPAVGVPGHGRWAPALITTTNAVLVPFGFAFTVTNLTTGEVIFTDAFSKEPAEHNPTTTTCTYQGDFTDEEGNIIRVQGTVDVVSHPLG
jgi:hypothetical protein